MALSAVIADTGAVVLSRMAGAAEPRTRPGCGGCGRRCGRGCGGAGVQIRPRPAGRGRNAQARTREIMVMIHAPSDA